MAEGKDPFCNEGGGVDGWDLDCQGRGELGNAVAGEEGAGAADRDTGGLVHSIRYGFLEESGIGGGAGFWVWWVWEAGHGQRGGLVRGCGSRLGTRPRGACGRRCRVESGGGNLLSMDFGLDVEECGRCPGASRQVPIESGVRGRDRQCIQHAQDEIWQVGDHVGGVGGGGGGIGRELVSRGVDGGRPRGLGFCLHRCRRRQRRGI